MDSFPEDSGRIAAVDLSVLDGLLPRTEDAPSSCPYADLCPWQSWNRPTKPRPHPLTEPTRPPEPPALLDDDELPSWRSSATRRKTPPSALALAPLSHDDLEQVRTAERVDGATLAHLRELRGVSLETICDRTKISMMILRFIEDDEHENLPAPVYLEGYLEQVRALLQLPTFVVGRYLEGLPDDGDQDGSTVRTRRR